MKKIYFFILILAFSISCSESYLDETPKGRLALDGFFNNSQDLDLALTALYKSLADFGFANYFNVAFFGDDQYTTRPGSNKEDYRDYDMFFSNKDNNTRNPYNWEVSYEIISAANFIINGADKAVLASEEERMLAKAQARFLRAHAYFYLVRVYNEVPLVTTNDVDLEMVKSAATDVYDLIIEDLKIAETDLPDQWNSGRMDTWGITSGAAKSLLSGVYLMMTGYPIKDESKYALASTKAKEVIDNASTYGYELLENFQDLWLDRPTNAEDIYSVYYSNSTPDVSYRAPYSGMPVEMGGWEDYFSEINFYLSFPEGPRKDATFYNEIILRQEPHDTIYWQEEAWAHPFFKKMLYANGTGPDNDLPLWEHYAYNCSRSTQFMRFAEVKLIYAEAKAMSSGPDASAYKEINDIRKRAGLPDLTPGLSAEAFRDSVIQERAWEFPEEYGQRWFDLVRLERVEEANSNRNEAELPLQNQPSKAFYFSPIPLEERIINPNLDDAVTMQ